VYFLVVFGVFHAASLPVWQSLSGGQAALSMLDGRHNVCPTRFAS